LPPPAGGGGQNVATPVGTCGVWRRDGAALPYLRTALKLIILGRAYVILGLSIVNIFFTARRYAAARVGLLILARYGPIGLDVSVSVCVCICLSQVGVLSKRMDGIIWFLVWGITSHTLCFKEIQVSTKMGNFLLELFLNSIRT